MAIDEGDVQRQRRRRHTQPHQRHEPRDPDDAPVPVDHTFEKPNDVAALREARLKSMVTPAATRKKMKIEYEYTKPVKAAAATATATATSKKQTSTPTPAFFSRRPTVRSTRPKSATTPEGKRSSNRVYQYVYQNRTESQQDEASKETEKETKQPKTPIERRKTTSSTTDKPKVQRRRTEPTAAVRRSSTTTTSRPQIKKSTTNTSIKDFAPNPSAEGASNIKTKAPQRTSSLLGSLFTKPSPIPEKLVSCLTCGSDDIPISKSAKLPCTHRMCHSCLKRIFKMSVKDPAHMPPRCCTAHEIALKHVDHLFDDAFKKTWNRKFKEYTAKNRIYCPRRGCGEWIQQKHFRIEQGRKIGVCPKCKYSVCAMCNQKAHKARECPKDPAMKQLSEIAEREGWVKCYNCSAMVELKEGCNHMTCRCMAEFCMVCGLKWKSCDCPWFNYEAVDDLRGNPVRYQQEMDRRREQLQRDEDIARQIAGLGLRGGRRRRANEARTEEQGHAQAEAEFLQQARDALTGRYQNAEVAARGLLGGWLRGREEPPIPAMPGAFDAVEEQPPLHAPIVANPVAPARRRTYRLRHANLGNDI